MHLAVFVGGCGHQALCPVVSWDVEMPQLQSDWLVSGMGRFSVLEFL